jgi:hypothetical protein
MFKKIWNFMNGKKRITGAVMTIVGGAMYFHPMTAPYATEIFVPGIGMLTGGYVHYKIKKKQKNNKE